MNRLAHFKELYYLADKLIGELTKDQLAEVTRLLALHVARYAQRYGNIPSTNVMDLLGVVEPTEQQAELMHDGMEVLVGYLGTVREMGEERAQRLAAGTGSGSPAPHR